MTNLELVLNMLAETATTEISEKLEPNNLEENKTVAREGGSVAGNARKDIEAKTGKRVITSENTKTLREDLHTSTKSIIDVERNQLKKLKKPP